MKSITEYFTGKNIFITGGSGFLGKPLIEKLLRSCPDVGNIYVLLRPKKEKALSERMEQILRNTLFDLLKEIHPENIKKIIPIGGDIMLPGLGLSKEDRGTLISQVHVIFHVAASVKFDDFLKYAVLTNIQGTKSVAELALETKHLEVFVLTSTTYCNIDHKTVTEDLYPSRGNWQDLLYLAENYSEEYLNILSRKYIDVFPNTYTYTKQLAEHCINDMLVGKVPTVICRPSIVVNALEEPFTGWHDNLNGPVGFLVGAGTGVLRTVYANPECETEFVPVDNIVKLLIVSAWNKAISYNTHELSIYQGSKYNQPPFKIGDYLQFGEDFNQEHPFEAKIWHCNTSMTPNWWYYFMNVLLFHLVPALFIDSILLAVGQKPRLYTAQRKIYIANEAVSHFLLNEWSFVNCKAMSLLNKIPLNEMRNFNFNSMVLGRLNMKHLFNDGGIYVKKKLFKESKTVTRTNLIVTKVLYYADKLVKITFGFTIFWITFIKIGILSLTWKAICDYWESLN